MAGFFGKIFGGAAPPPAEATSSTFDDSAAREVSRDATRRELLHSVARDTMRRYAIPSAWLEMRMLPASPGLHLVLSVREEAQRMYYFIRNFEESVVAELRRLDSKSDGWLHGISWQFPAKDMPTGRRSTDMAARRAAPLPPEAAPAVPAPEVPQPEAATAAVDAGAEKAAALADLERLFAVRDQELRRKADSGDHPEFAPTQPAFAPTQAGFEPSKSGFPPTEPGKL